LKPTPGICPNQSKLRFEPTYEELKLSTINYYLNSGNGFEPTYEELKQEKNLFIFSRRDKFWAYLWGIETYNKPIKVFLGAEVLSLPMRNWNLINIQAKTSLSPVLSLPMRNWNKYDTPSSSESLRGFEPTYEELKLAPNEVKIEIGNKFWAYLWGIETKKRWNYGASPSTFWAYLWGIETQQNHM